MRTLKDFLEVYEPKAPDEKKFKDKHVTIKFKDRNEVGGKENGDDVFNATNVKTVARKDNRQGYNVGEDEKVYEEADIESMDENELLEFALNLLEKTLTPAELKKREEIAKAIERENPDMPMAQKMAIATAQAKKVAEEVEYLDEATAKIVAHLQKRYGDNIRKSHVRSAANDFGVGYTGLAHAVRKKLGVIRLKEEADYSEKGDAERIRKRQEGWQKTFDAEKAMEKKAAAIKHANEFLKRYQNQKTVKEEAENDDGWYTHSQMYGSKKSEAHPKGISAAEWKSGIRWHHGKNKRINIKEEVEQIDELSNKTLGSYVKKATNQAFNKGFAGGANLSRGQEHEKEGERQVSKAVKRVIGVNKAVNKMTEESVDDVPFKGPYSKPGVRKDEHGNTIKNVPRHLARKAMKALTKEDIIDRAVSKYVPEELKYTPEERMIKRLEGLREDHINMLMGLFESLNDGNQSKMIESAETEEGLNQLLDFAIHNRGA